MYAILHYTQVTVHWYTPVESAVLLIPGLVCLYKVGWRLVDQEEEVGKRRIPGSQEGSRGVEVQRVNIEPT